ncbi:MAG: hypothetical protein Q8926_18065, partial [Bacteroidota bacterium]|nr:hypothetical protein [Bacteroidota bacterium]
MMHKSMLLFLLLTARAAYAQNTDPVKMLDPRTDKPGEEWCYLAKSTTVIGVPFQPDVTQVTYDGALFTREAELCFFYGADNKPLLARGKTFIDGWIPIVQYRWKEGNINYDIEYIASPLPGEGPENTVNFVRISMHNTGAAESPGQFTAALRYDGGDYRFGHSDTDKFSSAWRYSMTGSDVIRDGKLVYSFSSGGNREAVSGKLYSQAFTGSQYSITPMATCCLVKYKRALKPGERFSATFKMPRVPVPLSETGFLSKLKNTDYSSCRKSTMDYWKTMMRDATEFEIPEKRFQNAYRAGLVHVMLATRQREGKKYQTDGLPYPDFFLTSVPEMSMLYLSSGLSQYPKDLLIPGAIAQQQPDGLFYDISVAHGQIIPATQGHILYSISMTAIFTQDKSFAEKVYPAIAKGVRYIEQSVNTDEYGLLPPCYAYDAEMITGHYTGQNLFALMGLRTAVRVAAMLGHADDVAAWTNLAGRYEKNILKALDASAKAGGYIPPGLYPYLTGAKAREGMEEYQTNCDWENMILAYPTEILSPDDPKIKGTLSRIRKEYAEGVMTYRHGMHLHQYITANMVEQYLASGDQYTALKDFYHQLLHSGSTLECFENLVKPWTDRSVDPDCPTPHAWGSAKQALMVRYFLLMEYGGKCGLEPGMRELWLFHCLSPDWVQPGKKVSIINARTEFGRISASIKFRSTGADLLLKNQFHANPKYYRIRMPYFKRLVSFSSDAKIQKQDGDCLLLSPDDPKIKGTLSRIRKEYAEGVMTY